MAALCEAWNNQPQAIRKVDGVQNGAQGANFNYWRLAEYVPCLLYQVLPPPIHWNFDSALLPGNDPRRSAAAGFIRRYGVNSAFGKH